MIWSISNFKDKKMNNLNLEQIKFIFNIKYYFGKLCCAAMVSKKKIYIINFNAKL